MGSCADEQAMVSLLFSFMVIWDLPNLRRGVAALKTSRLGFGYRTIAPQVTKLLPLLFSTNRCRDILMSLVAYAYGSGDCAACVDCAVGVVG